MATPNLLYLFNEASSGTTPTNVIDSSTGTPLNMAITYGTSSWATIGAGRGLNFSGTCIAVSAALNGTKVATALAGITGATIEAVVDTTNYTGFNTIFGLQDAGGTNDIFVMLTGSAGANQVGVAGAGGTAAWFDVTPGLHHLMAVQDTSQATAANRLLLYVDGALASVNSTPFAPTYPTLNQAIDATFTNYANNRIGAGGLVSAGTESFVGPIYFAALYASALTSGDASAHSTATLANNDADPNGAAAAFVPFRRLAPQIADDDPPPPQRRVFRVPPASAAAPSFVPFRRVVVPAAEEDAAIIPRRRMLVPQTAAAPATFIPYRRQPPQQPDDLQYLFMGVRSATIQSGPVVPDSPPLGWPRRVLSLFQQSEDDQPRLRRPTVTASGLPPVIPDNPPVGWPRRVIALAQGTPADDEVRIQQRRCAPASAPVVVPDNPPIGWPRRVISLATWPEDEVRPQQRRFVPIAAPVVVPDSPPWGWPRRLAVMRAMAEAMPDDLGRRPSSIAAAIAPPPIVPPFQAGPFTIAPVDVVLTIREVTT